MKFSTSRLALSLIALSVSTLSFAANIPTKISDTSANNFLSLTYNFPIVQGTSTQGDTEVTLYSDGHYKVKDNNLSYQSASSPELTLGHHCTPWLDLAVSIQQLKTDIGTKNSIEGSGTDAGYNDSLHGSLMFTNTMFKAFFKLGNGMHMGKTLMTPFVNLGLGYSHWNLSGLTSMDEAYSFNTKTGNDFSYEAGLGVNSTITNTFSLVAGVNYLYLGKYNSGTAIAGFQDNFVAQQAVSAKVASISPYVGLRLAF